VANVSWTDADGFRSATVTPVPFGGTDIDVNVILKKSSGHLDIRGLKELPNGTIAPLSGAAIGLCPRTLVCISDWLQIQSKVPNSDAETRPLLGSDGNLRLTNLMEGLYDLYSIVPGEGFYFESARQGDHDALLDGITVSSDAPVLEIRVQPGPGRLRGKVVNDVGQANPSAIVRLLPNSPLDATKLRALRREIHADQNGDFDITGIIPGEYHAYSWSADHSDGWGGYDNKYIDSELVATGHGKPVSIERGRETFVDLVPLN
jgi:hypothetical protein